METASPLTPATVRTSQPLPPLLRARLEGSRKGVLRRDVRFSWLRAATSLASYVLLLSDVPRSGLGVRESAYPIIAPNEIVTFGPFAYPVFHARRESEDEIVGDDGSVWPYKFDTVSVALRAFATHLDLRPPWPPCIMYKHACPDDTLSTSTVFLMLDALVDAVATRRDARNRLTPVITLRVAHWYIDRLHHFVCPQFFRDRNVDTSQALYYDPELLQRAQQPESAFCFAHQQQHRARPFVCSYYSFAPIGTNMRRQVGQDFLMLAKRHVEMQQLYPNASIDMLVVESDKDSGASTLNWHGRKPTELTMITRARRCHADKGDDAAVNALTVPSSVTCSTIAIDDFRIELQTVTSSVRGWFPVVATLRTFGQVYAWVRVFVLFVGCCCYANDASEQPQQQRTCLWSRLRAGTRTFFLIPSQVVVYGSIIPIACYVVAHALDSGSVYEFVTERFDSTLGAIEFNLQQLVQVTSVSMRSVWVLALLLHVAVWSATSTARWSHADGIPSIHEYVVSFVACSTIFAQLRAISFRDTRIVSVTEVPVSPRIAAVRAVALSKSLSLGNALDVKCLLAGALVCVLFAALVRLLKHVLVKIHWIPRRCTDGSSLWSHTLVPYSAGVLWPTTALVVCWNDIVVWNQRREALHKARKVVEPTQVAPETVAMVGTWMNGTTQRKKQPKKRSVQPSQTSSQTSSQRESDCASSRKNNECRPSRKRVQCTFCSPDDRSCEVESMILLMNLAAMTDPIALLQLWWSNGSSSSDDRGTAVGVYESRVTKRVFLLPLAAVEQQLRGNTSIDWNDYTLLFVTTTKHLTWCELLRCG